MQIFIASDHAGFELKKKIISYLEENGFDVVDKGPENFDPKDDYPDTISKLAEEISKDPLHSRGIVIGLSGQGEALVANKFKGVRAGVYYGGPTEIITLMREHNDTNVLSLGAKYLSQKEAEKAVDLWIETEFSNDPRHKRRIQKIYSIEIQHIQ